MKNSLSLLLFCMVFISHALCSADSDPFDQAKTPPLYSMWIGAMPKSRSDFEAKVVRAALEQSRDQYGGFLFTEYSGSLSNTRAEREVFSGEEIQLKTYEKFPPNEPGLNGFLWLTNPFISGILGYRVLLTTRDKLPLFTNIHSLADLKKLRVGQVAGWEDSKIYQNNGFNLVQATGFKNLFPMMANGRYDYLPLGYIEAKEILNAHLALYPDLVIVPDIYIYYSLPIYLIVSPAHPELLQRLDFGFKKLAKSGQGRALLSEHHQVLQRDIAKPGARLFIADGSEPQLVPYKAYR